MADSQPGKVTTFDPSVSLTNFSASSKDHLLFNENHLVVAKVQQTRPIFAYAENRSSSNVVTTFDGYKNLSGEFVYIDGSFQALSTEGAPTLDVHRIIVGFDQQVSTGEVVFWSTEFLDTETLAVTYSFDNVTFFSVGAITWSYIFDDTIQRNPTDIPATGEYKYTGNFDGGALTGRYWRIQSDREANWVSGTGATITVDSTAGFPTSNATTRVRTDTGGSGGTFDYTGKTPTTFTGKTGTTNFGPEYIIFNTTDPFGNGVTEVRILQVTSPTLKHWDSDGDEAVPVIIDGANYYHLAYDKTDDVYYGLRLDTDLQGSPPDPNDDFDTGTDTSFDRVLWTESATDLYFERNVASGTLDYRSSGGPGRLDATYGMSGTFISAIDLTAMVKQNDPGAYFSLQTTDFDTGNHHMLSGIKGAYRPDNRLDSAGAHILERPASGGGGAPTWSQAWNNIDLVSSVDYDGGLVALGKKSENALTLVNSATGASISTAFLRGLTGYTFGADSDFGASVAIDDGVVVVGMPADTINGSASGRAAVFILGAGNSLTFEAYLAPSDATANFNFGESVAIDNGTIAIGASGAAAVYTFTRVGGTWTQQQKLVATDAEVIGTNVAIESNTIIAGAPKDDATGVDSGSAYVFFYSGSWAQQEKLEPADPTAGDEFGYSVDVYGDLAIIGAPFSDLNGSSSGSAYVFDRLGSSWTETQKLTTLDAAANKEFGHAVSVFNETIVVTTNESNPSAYVWEVAATVWFEDIKLTPTAGSSVATLSIVSLEADVLYFAPTREFSGNPRGVVAYNRLATTGAWVALSEVPALDVVGTGSYGNDIAMTATVSVVGVPTSNVNGENSGAAYVFLRNDLSDSWAQAAQLLPSDGFPGQEFGYSVSITDTDDTIIVGARGDATNGTNAGAAYIYTFGGGTWTQSKKIVASGVGVDDAFGTSVSIHADTAAVGAPGDDTHAMNSGAAYIFDRDGGAWTEQATVSGVIGSEAGDIFGTSVSVSGDRVAVGAPSAQGNPFGSVDGGIVYIYERDGGAWSVEDSIYRTTSGEDAQPGDLFGTSVAVYDDPSFTRIVVGAPSDDFGLVDVGAAYVYNWGGASWDFDTRLQADDPQVGSKFGSSVALYKDVAMVGAPEFDGAAGERTGAAYVFENDAGWSQTGKFQDQNSTSRGRYGYAVATGSGTLGTVDLLELSTPTWIGAAVEYTDTFAGSVVLQNFKLRPNNFNFSAAAGVVVYTIISTGGSTYTVAVNGVIQATSAQVGTKYVVDSTTAQAEFLLAELSTPAAGLEATITVRFGDALVNNPTTTSGLQLQIERINTNAYARYRESGDPGFTTLHTGNITANSVQRIQVYGDSNSEGVNIGADNFAASGTLFYDSPVFSLVTINKAGNLVQVAGVSDIDGYAIKRFDVIKNTSAVYNDYLTPVTGVATNGGTGGAGEIYIKVGEDLYKYIKSNLPLDLEDGSGASATSTGEIPNIGITGFAYNGYTQAGLSFVEYIDDLSGVFLKTVNTSDLLANTSKVWLDVVTANYPFTWNVTDLATLYYVDGTALKLYDLNETKAAFVNVSSDKQVLAAGTAETATITAQVLNVYGEPKSNKTMTFSVSAGDGAISPAIGCSDGTGLDTTTYTVGSAVGAATITVTVSDLTC